MSIADLLERLRSEVEATTERTGGDAPQWCGPARAADRAAAEKARERNIAPAYRELLDVVDGYGMFFGTRQLRGDAYDDAEELLSYDDEFPEALQDALIIGGDGEEMTILMTDDGRVTEWRVGEGDEFPTLAAYLEHVVEASVAEREAYVERARAFESQWTVDVRVAGDQAALESARARLTRARPVAAVAPEVLARLGDADATRQDVTELVARGHWDEDEGDVSDEQSAAVGLGLTLYLGSAPSPQEVMETARAFRRHFPIEGPFRWMRSGDTELHEETDPDAEPFAGTLRLTSDGQFGLRLSVPLPSGDLGPLLNVRCLPDGPGPDGELRPAAPFVEVWVPADRDPEAVHALARDLVELLPVRSGHGGYSAMAFNEEGFWPVRQWCGRYFGVVPAWVDGWLGSMLTEIRGAHWLTVLGTPLVRALDEHGPRPDDSELRYHEGANGLVVRAGECTLADMAFGELPSAMATVARWTAPLTTSSCFVVKRGYIGLEEVTEIPEFDPGETEAWLRRLIDPAGFVPWTYLGGGDPRAALERLVAEATPAALRRMDDPEVLAAHPERVRFAQVFVDALEAEAIDLVVAAAAHRADGGGELVDLVRPLVDRELGNELAVQGRSAASEDEFALARVLFDLALTRDDLELTHYLSATWVAQQDNAGIPIVREQCERIYDMAATKAAEYPAIYLNLVCLDIERNDPDRGLDVIETALGAGHVGRMEFDKEPFIAELRQTERYARIVAGASRTSSDNLEVIDAWKAWLEAFPIWSIAQTKPSADRLAAREGTSPELAEHLHEFAATRRGSVLAIYGEDGTFEQGPVVLIGADAEVRVLGDSVPAALAVLCRVGESRALEQAIAKGSYGEKVGGFEAWLTAKTPQIVDDVPATVVGATRAHASVVRHVRTLLGADDQGRPAAQ